MSLRRRSSRSPARRACISGRRSPPAAARGAHNRTPCTPTLLPLPPRVRRAFELVRVPAAPHAEPFDGVERGLLGQHRDRESPARRDEVVSEVLLVDRHRKSLRRRGLLHERVDHASAPLPLAFGRQDIQPVTYLKQQIHRFIPLQSAHKPRNMISVSSTRHPSHCSLTSRSKASSSAKTSSTLPQPEHTKWA